LIKDLFNRLRKKEKQQRYWLQKYTVSTATTISLNKDNLIELQEFKAGKRTDLTRWEFLGDATYRLERGQHCYTWVENDCLLGCAWFSYQEVHSAGKEHDTPEAGSTIELQRLYCHATGRNRLPDFINEVIGAAINKERKTYFLTSEPLYCKALELAGGKAQ
jgi:hypothetical protein